MRNPFRTEAEAFSFVLVCVALFAAVALAGILGGGWVALGVFVVARCRCRVLREGRAQGRTAGPVAASRGDRGAFSWSRTRRSPVVRFAVRSCAGPGADADVLVVCPALNSPLRHWASDEDGARAEAERRLELRSRRSPPKVWTRAARSATPTPSRRWKTPCGRSAPTRSSSPPTRRGGRTGSRRRSSRRARERYPVPITHVVVDLELERRRSTPKGAEAPASPTSSAPSRCRPGRRSGHSPGRLCRRRWRHRRLCRPRPGR